MGFHRFVVATCVLAFAVIVLGAFTRLTDAGLGCPDWPGCYGRLIVPATEAEVADTRYLAQRALEPEKGWMEMIHRYFAGALGLSILGITIWSWRRRRDDPRQPVWLPTFLLALVVFQALLGMWTVTLLLKPVVVMAHLLGGFATFALLVLLALRSAPRRPRATLPRWRLAAAAGVGILVVQIALGGWTSTNYAALSCLDFPTCQGRWLPEMDFGEAFVMWRGLGVDYEYGVLEHPARTAIHVTHRVGAVITLLYLGWLVLRMLRADAALTGAAMLIGGLLLVQVGLGVGNVLLHLPLGVATAHNAVAALLLAALVYLNFRVWQPRQH
jgi:cytochrome c oxidase assembly protein subunit 15